MHITPINSLKHCASLTLNTTKELSCIFWDNIFNTENIIELLEFSSSFETTENLPDSILKFINSSDIKSDLKRVLNIITGIGIENKLYFESIEIVNYLLWLYSEYYYNNFSFGIDNAFDIEADSIEQIVKLAEDSEYNPYFSFLEKYYLPILEKENPKIIFVNGRPNLFNFSQLYFAKKMYPSAYVFITNHSSEYYSLNKITKYLKINEILFSWIDGIILDDFTYTENLLTNAIKNKTDLLTIPNILIKTINGIQQTKYVKRKRKVSEIIVPDLLVEFDNLPKIKSSFEIFETNLLINNKCHWSKCSYCGINAKYPTKINSVDDIRDYLKLFNSVSEKNYKLLVLQDEAIPVDIAYKIAVEKIKTKNNLAWHYRSRIDLNYTDEVITKLAESNLKGIYFGLESVNKRIIKLMNKYSRYIEPVFIEQLADKLFENNIHCHFCVIIGFPTETKDEIYETLNFISKIKKKYPKFTFTVNIFESDITSPIFVNDIFNLNAKLPVPENLYISNKLLFDRTIPYSDLVNIKIKFLIDNISDINSNITEVIENPNSLINFINRNY